MESPSYKYRSLAEMARALEEIAEKYVRSHPRSKLDHAFNKGQASGLFAAAEILRRAIIEPAS